MSDYHSFFAINNQVYGISSVQEQLERLLLQV